MAESTRRGLAAGISIVLGVLVAVLVNLVTEGQSWPLAAGLVVLVLASAVLAMRQAAQPATGRTNTLIAHDAHGRWVEQRSVVPHQLPAPVRHFAGRADELQALTGLLGATAKPASTAVTSAIDGSAGVGKTTLAIHWGHQVRDRFPDGQLYVNLRGFDPSGSPVEPATAIRGFLDALGVPPQCIPPDMDAQAALYRTLLADRRMLVILDNARDAEHIRPLLPGSPGCFALVTSRNRLTGLIAAEGAHPLNLDLLSVEEARDLLGQRLGAGRVAAERRAVEEIIELCTRLPLALAVAAAHAVFRPNVALANLAVELREARLSALNTRDAATDIRAVFSWSYRALNSEAARLFRLLGLHPGPDISLPAAASLAGVPFTKARAQLAALADANLVEEHAYCRYAFHDLLRAYAVERSDHVDSSEERRAATHRMLDHYLHTAFTGARLLDPHRRPIVLDSMQPATISEKLTDYQQAMDWFTTEHSVLLAIVEYAATTGWDGHTWQLAWAIEDFLDRRGHWHQRVITGHAAVRAAHRQAEPLGRAYAHRSLVRAYTLLDDFEPAGLHLQLALAILVRLDDKADQAYIHLTAAFMWDRRDRPAKALDHVHEALALFQAVNERRGLAGSLHAIGWLNSRLGDHEQALIYCEQALPLMQELGERIGEAGTWDSLGWAHHHLGNHQQAVDSFLRALELFRDLGDHYEQATTLTHLGDTYHAAGDSTGAYTAWQEALAILEKIDHPYADEVRERVRVLTFE